MNIIPFHFCKKGWFFSYIHSLCKSPLARMKFSIFFPYTYLSAPPPRCCRELEQEVCFEKEGNLSSVACEIPNRNERECCAHFADKKGKKPAWKNSDQIVFEYNKFTNKVIKDCRENIESAQSL